MPALKLMVWNMEWLNDLFTSAHNLRHPEHKTGHGNGATVQERLDDLSAVIHDPVSDPDIIVVVEGPNTTSELQKFFDHAVNGIWETHIQLTKGSAQCIGVAVRKDTDKFEDTAIHEFNSPQIRAFRPFRYDTDNDGIVENYKFERNPLYVEIAPKNGDRFRILGLHLKSKGIFSAYEWSKWWSIADANRKKLVAQATRVKVDFLDQYLIDDETRDIPLIVCGDINDGPGLDASEKRLLGSAVERLMGNVWNPDFTLGNALFDSLSDRDKKNRRFEELSTTRYRDPIFNSAYHNVWIDHIMYTRNRPDWVRNGRVIRQMDDGKYIWSKHRHASDHQPVMADIHV